MRSDNKSEEVSHEYLYDPVSSSVGGMAIRSQCISCSGWVHSHPAHRRCNFADHALCARQDYLSVKKMSSRSRQENDASHLCSLFTVSNLDQIQRAVCVNLLSPKHHRLC